MDTVISLAIWAGLFYLMMRFGCGAHMMGHGHNRSDHANHGDHKQTQGVRWVPPATDVDPVCGKTVRSENAKSSVYDGQVYYFCSRDCREQFEAAPGSYLRAKLPVGPPELEPHNA